jgi:proteasome assembly chaperone 3
MTHLTPTTVLGGTGTSERETLTQLYATQIASAIVMRNPEETRMLVLGLGLQKVDLERETFFDMMDLVGKCL